MLISFVYPTRIHEVGRLSMIWDSGRDMSPTKNWQSLRCGASVYYPASQKPKCIIHFVGGFIAGRFPVFSYIDMLEALGEAGCIVVATKVSLALYLPVFAPFRGYFLIVYA